MGGLPSAYRVFTQKAEAVAETIAAACFSRDPKKIYHIPMDHSMNYYYDYTLSLVIVSRECLKLARVYTSSDFFSKTLIKHDVTYKRKMGLIRGHIAWM